MSLLKSLQKSTLSGMAGFDPFGGPSGGDGSGEAAAAEEARKDALRKRIDKFYGIAEKLPVYGEPDMSNPAQWLRSISSVGALRPVVGYEDDPEAAAARATMEAENTKLGDATRSYYTDQLGKDYAKAERGTRFNLARKGLLGGSEDVFQQGEVKSDRDLGATRVDDAVRRAIAGLTSQREQERLSAINLVNSGAGDSAVSAAQAGLKNSLDTAASAQKADLFGDLFANSANAVANSNIADQQAALASRYRDRLSTFFPARSSTSGRVTPSA